MKKGLKIALIFISSLIGIDILDTLQAKLLDNSPFIKVTKIYSECFKEDIGIFVETDIINDNKKKTYFKWDLKAEILPGCSYDFDKH